MVVCSNSFCSTGKADKPANDESPYYSVDPTPALPASTPTEELRAKLLNEKLPMFEVGIDSSV